MYARSTTWQGNSQAIDDAVAYTRDEAMPAITAMDGSIGVSMLCDRDTGRCIVTTAWASEAAMNDSADAVRGSRDRAGEILGDPDPDVRQWEIAALHRMHEGHDGARARVLWGEIDPAHAQEAMSTFRMTMMPRLEDLPGFCSVSVMVDRATGRSAMTTCYDTREDMDRATGIATSMREQFSRALGVNITDMAEFDLVLHHLRVPETV